MTATMCNVAVVLSPTAIELYVPSHVLNCCDLGEGPRLNRLFVTISVAENAINEVSLAASNGLWKSLLANCRYENRQPKAT